MTRRTRKQTPVATAILQCKQCGHRWFRRVFHPPLKCPRCQSKHWNEPKKGD